MRSVLARLGVPRGSKLTRGELREHVHLAVRNAGLHDVSVFFPSRRNGRRICSIDCYVQCADDGKRLSDEWRRCMGETPSAVPSPSAYEQTVCRILASICPELPDDGDPLRTFAMVCRETEHAMQCYLVQQQQQQWGMAEAKHDKSEEGEQDREREEAAPRPPVSREECSSA